MFINHSRCQTEQVLPVVGIFWHDNRTLALKFEMSVELME